MIMDRNGTTWVQFIFFLLAYLKKIDLHIRRGNANISRGKPGLVIIHPIALRKFRSPDLHKLYHQGLVEIMKAEMLWILSEQLRRMREVSGGWRGLNVFPVFKKGKKKRSIN